LWPSENRLIKEGALMNNVRNKRLSKDQIIDFLKQNKPYIKKNFGVTKIALFSAVA